MKGALVALPLFVTLLGCTSSKSSRDLARLTLSEVASYEKDVHAVNDAVKRSFQRQLEDSRTAVAAQTEQVRESARAALAVEGGEKAVSKGFDVASFRQFLIASRTAGSVHIERFTAQLAMLAERSTTGDAELAALDKSAKELRQKLEMLQNRPKRREELDVYRKLAVAAREALAKAKQQ